MLWWPAKEGCRGLYGAWVWSVWLICLMRWTAVVVRYRPEGEVCVRLVLSAERKKGGRARLFELVYGQGASRGKLDDRREPQDLMAADGTYAIGREG